MCPGHLEREDAIKKMGACRPKEHIHCMWETMKIRQQDLLLLKRRLLYVTVVWCILQRLPEVFSITPNALISSNLCPRRRVITTLKQLFMERFFFVFSFFKTFHFVNKALTYCIRTLLLWCVYLMLSSRWHATEWRCCVATSSTKATKSQGTSPVSTVTQCSYKPSLLWSHIGTACCHLQLRILGPEPSVTRIARSEAGACSEHLLRTGKCCQWFEVHKAKRRVSHHTLPKPRAADTGVPALLLTSQLYMRWSKKLWKNCW